MHTYSVFYRLNEYIDKNICLEENGTLKIMKNELKLQGEEFNSFKEKCQAEILNLQQELNNERNVSQGLRSKIETIEMKSEHSNNKIKNLEKSLI